MATQTKENYLKAIYFLDQKTEKVSITALGQEMNVSKPTVNNMIKKLDAQGWIKYEKYKPIQLTQEGKLAAAMIIRKHRLTEMFLVKIMGFGWEEVHDIAEEVEHLKAQTFFDRMDEILGFPTTDPHGSPIPDREGNVRSSNLIQLSQVEAGQVAELKAIGDSSVDLLLLLNEKEVSLGTQFSISKIEAFDKTMYVTYGDKKTQTLSHEVCKRLMVELVD